MVCQEIYMESIIQAAHHQEGLCLMLRQKVGIYIQPEMLTHMQTTTLSQLVGLFMV
jgi:hypothetical protein